MFKFIRFIILSNLLTTKLGVKLIGNLMSGMRLETAVYHYNLGMQHEGTPLVRKAMGELSQAFMKYSRMANKTRGGLEFAARFYDALSKTVDQPREKAVETMTTFFDEDTRGIN